MHGHPQWNPIQPVLILGFRGAMFPALGTKCCSDRSYQHARALEAWGASLRALLQREWDSYPGRTRSPSHERPICQKLPSKCQTLFPVELLHSPCLPCTHKYNCDLNNRTSAYLMDEGRELPHQKYLKADPSLSKDQLLVFNLSLISVKWRKSYVFSATLV